jgi:hypothetical protein
VVDPEAPRRYIFLDRACAKDSVALRRGKDIRSNQHYKHLVALGDLVELKFCKCIVVAWSRCATLSGRWAGRMGGELSFGQPLWVLGWARVDGRGIEVRVAICGLGPAKKTR